MKNTVLALTCFVILAAFTSNDSASTSFYNTKWVLQAMQSGDSLKEIAPGKAFIRFNEEKKSGGGNGSCNSFGSSITVNKDSIQISSIFSTKMYCEAVQATESSFFRLLEKVNRFEIKDKNLLLYHDKTALLSFIAE
jgi:heat shock protein HslJ